MEASRQSADAAQSGGAGHPTLVFVSRRHCGASRRMESLVAWVKVTQKKRLRVVDLDADHRPELAQHLGVHETPALVLLEEGEVVGKLEGRATGRQIDALIRPHLAEGGAMTVDNETPEPDETGYGAAQEGALDDASEQAQQRREPPSDEEAAQDDYANSDEHSS